MMCYYYDYYKHFSITFHSWVSQSSLQFQLNAQFTSAAIHLSNKTKSCGTITQVNFHARESLHEEPGLQPVPKFCQGE